MKYLALLLILSVQVFAHEITGTPVREGSLKTKIRLDRVDSTCKVKIVKRSNLTFEDSYGNPGYKVIIDINLFGLDILSGRSVNFQNKFTLTNMFDELNEKVVRDYEYQSEDGQTKLLIDEEGYLKKVEFLYKNYQNVTCNF